MDICCELRLALRSATFRTFNRSRLSNFSFNNGSILFGTRFGLVARLFLFGASTLLTSLTLPDSSVTRVCEAVVSYLP
jgi:hypothetical protein